MTVELNLTVNDIPIKTDYFVASYIDHTVSGILESLEGTEKIKDLYLSIDGDLVKILLNGGEIPINDFVIKITKSTLFGMVSVLKGVKNPQKLKLEIHK